MYKFLFEIFILVLTANFRLCSNLDEKFQIAYKLQNKNIGLTIEDVNILDANINLSGQINKTGEYDIFPVVLDKSCGKSEKSSLQIKIEKEGQKFKTSFSIESNENEFVKEGFALCIKEIGKRGSFRVSINYLIM